MTGYPFLDLVWTMLVFFGWVIWFWLLIVIFGDLFRRHDVSGWAKAGWMIVLILLPFVGVLIYLIAEGRHMGERKMAEAQSAQKQFDAYVRSVSTPTHNGASEEIAKAKKLLDDGTITEDEYRTLKTKALAHTS
jgi:hypothetical protein